MECLGFLPGENFFNKMVKYGTYADKAFKGGKKALFALEKAAPVIQKYATQENANKLIKAQQTVQKYLTPENVTKYAGYARNAGNTMRNFQSKAGKVLGGITGALAGDVLADLVGFGIGKNAVNTFTDAMI